MIGNHYSNLGPSNQVRGDEGPGAREKVQRERGNSGTFITTLYINPETGIRFYEVDSQRFDSRKVFHINAETGDKIKEYSNLQESLRAIRHRRQGRHQADTTSPYDGTAHQMISDDGRQATYDAKNKQKLPGTLFSDVGRHVEPRRSHLARPASGRRRPLLRERHRRLLRDHLPPQQPRRSGHTDGLHRPLRQELQQCLLERADRSPTATATVTDTFCELSGGLDVATHEFTHGVTDFTSGLVYQDESGALNEAFSDILGNSSEFFAEERPRPSRPDWQIGEDIYLPDGKRLPQHGRPGEDGDPDHYSERYTGKATTAAFISTPASPTTPTTCSSMAARTPGRGAATTTPARS